MREPSHLPYTPSHFSDARTRTFLHAVGTAECMNDLGWMKTETCSGRLWLSFSFPCLIKWICNKASLPLECRRIAYLEENGKSSIFLRVALWGCLLHSPELVLPLLCAVNPSLISSSADGLSSTCIIASLECSPVCLSSLFLEQQPFLWLCFVPSL